MTAKREVKIIGHRGGKLVWPENGLTGFRAVIGLGVDGVEFDIHPSADGELFVIHDPTLDRTTVAQGPVAARKAAELRTIALKDGKGDTVPTLDQVLDVLGPAGFDLHVEIKLDANGQRYPGIEAKVAEKLERRGVMKQAVVTSFSPDVVAELRRVVPRGRVLASINSKWAADLGGFETALRRFKAIPIDYFAVEKSLMKTTLDLCRAHFADEQLVGWVVNEADEIDEWLRQPIGWIDTDRPDLAMEIRRRQAAARS
ncbi:MAG: glycerophosphodiester phosphodiesterase [Alphaproteobacteria bacterium]|nr:glycerophosphodiester phosphodiesterase [Alphaproteobacteria bacterium]